jgi:hypothetical protein
MAPGRISIEIRELLRIQAQDRCGYCLAPQSLVYASLEIDHIIPIARGGSDDVENLWLVCRPCNQYKAAQVDAIDPVTLRRVKLFNPRRQSWKRHFRWSENWTQIMGLTVCGRATVVALHLNNPFAVQTRRYWVSAGWHLLLK